jgi:hypothetical protein
MFRRSGYRFTAKNIRHSRACSGEVDTGSPPRTRATRKVPNATGTEGVDVKGNGTTPKPSRSVNDRVLKRLLNYRRVTPYAKDPVTLARFPPN